jgi:glycosyltransferase involved in cell wall biosynthesis
MKVLFITWDAPRVSYLEGLFIPAFIRLKSCGISIDILQFRWGDENERLRIAELCEKEGFGYRSIRVLRWPSNFAGTLITILSSGRAVRRAVSHFRPDVIHVRTAFAGTAVLLAGGARLAPLIYDSDGLESDGRVETGNLSASGLPYRLLRDAEGQLLRMSAQVLTRTKFGADVLWARAGPGIRREQFHVVPCGREPALFRRRAPSEREETRRQLGFGSDDPVLVYVGALTDHYRIPDVARFARAVQHRIPSTKLLVLTGDPEQARHRLAEGDPSVAEAATIFRAAPADVPRFLSIADVGFSSFDDLIVSRAGAPIKLGEYLLCGVPVIGTLAVGETGPAQSAGVFFDDRLGPEAAANWIIEEVLPHRDKVADVARRVGEACFGIDKTVDVYAAAFALAVTSERKLA